MWKLWKPGTPQFWLCLQLKLHVFWFVFQVSKRVTTRKSLIAVQGGQRKKPVGSGATTSVHCTGVGVYHCCPCSEETSPHGYICYSVYHQSSCVLKSHKFPFCPEVITFGLYRFASQIQESDKKWNNGFYQRFFTVLTFVRFCPRWVCLNWAAFIMATGACMDQNNVFGCPFTEIIPQDWVLEALTLSTPSNTGKNSFTSYTEAVEYSWSWSRAATRAREPRLAADASSDNTVSSAVAHVIQATPKLLQDFWLILVLVLFSCKK